MILSFSFLFFLFTEGRMGFYFSGRCRNRSGSWGMGPSVLGVGSLLGINDQLSAKIESGTKPVAGCRGQDPCVGRVGGLQIIETSAVPSGTERVEPSYQGRADRVLGGFLSQVTSLRLPSTKASRSEEGGRVGSDSVRSLGIAGRQK